MPLVPSHRNAKKEITGYRHHLVLASVVGGDLILPVDVETYGRATVNTEPGSVCWLACARTWEHASSTMWWLTENLPRPLSSILRERRVGR